MIQREISVTTKSGSVYVFLSDVHVLLPGIITGNNILTDLTIFGVGMLDVNSTKCVTTLVGSN